MVATVTGNSLGLSLTSLATLNGQGSGGNAALGRSGEGVYVNTATGNLVVQDRDGLVVSRGFDALALRTYNSQGLLSDDNIDNWSNGIYAQQVRLASGTLNAAGSTLVRTDRDGAQATYTYNATLSAYVSSDGDGAFDRIVYETSGTRFTWTDGDSGLQERYDASGKITASIDPLGGSLTYTYIASRTTTYTGSLLSQVTDASGEKLVFTYAAGTNNLVELSTVRIDDPAQPTVTTTLSRVRYTYNNNRLETVTVDLTPDVTTDAKTYVTTYAYTDATSKRIASITQTDGSLVSFVYTQVPAGGAYRVTQMTQTSVGGTTPVTRITNFAYDTANRKTTVTDPLGNATVYTYDTAAAGGRLLSVQGPLLNGAAQTFSYAYNASGDLTSQTDAQGNVTTYGYDANGNQTSSVDALGNTITRTFSTANKLLTETLLTSPALVVSGGMTLSGSTATKTGGTPATWDSSVFSNQGVTGGASVSFVPQIGQNVSVGLNTDPGTNNHRDSIDWAIQVRQDGVLIAYENGLAAQTLGTAVAGDTLTVTYDGAQVRYIKNGIILRSVAAVITLPLYADSSFYDSGASVSNLQFGELRPASAPPASNLLASSGLTLNGDTATKTGTSTLYDTGFRSDIGYVGGAAISFSPAQANKSLVIGLNTDPTTDNGRNSVDWALHCSDTGALFTWQNGDNKGQIGTYVAGDVLGVVYDGSTVKYYKNGVVLKTVNVVITQPLYADSSFSSNAAQVTRITFLPTLPSLAPPAFIASTGITLVGSTVTKTATTGNWDTGFRSSTGHLSPVAVSFSPAQANKTLVVGLNTDPATDEAMASIDWGFYLASNGNLSTRQNGADKGVVGTYVAGDVLGVSYDGTSVRYYKNGVVLKTVAAVITQPLYADGSLLTSGAQLTGLAFGTNLFGMKSSAESATTRYIYDANNLLRYVIGAEGSVCEYSYNSYGQRTASIDYADARYPVSLLASTATPIDTTLNAWRDALTAAQKQATVRVDTFYDFRGQVDKVVRYSSVDSAGNGVTTGASTTQYVYDQAGNLLKTIEPKGVATTGIATDFVTQYFYDGLSRVYKFTDALGVTTLTDYQDANAKTVVTLANGLSTTRAYNKAGELIGVLQSDGATALGTTSYDYDKNGNLRRFTDPTGLSTYSLYDTGGRKVADVDGTGSLIEYVYNQNGLVVRSIRYATAVSSGKLGDLANDINANTNLVTLATLKSGLALTASDRGTRLIYDKANRLAKSIDELGFVSETQYNNAGQVIAVVRYGTALTAANLAALTNASLPTDAATSPLLNASLDRRTRFFYDAEGKTLGSLDAEGYLTENQYDTAGRLVHTVTYANLTANVLWITGTLAQLRPATDATKDVHTWTTYNAQNQVLRSLDGEGYLTMFAYDLNGNQTLSTRYNKQQVAQPNTFTSNAQLAALVPINDAQDRTSSRTYTDLNQIRTATDFQGTVTQYTYDNVGQLIKAEKAFGTAELRVLQTRYDKLGRVVGELTAEGSAALAALSSPTAAQIDAVWADYGLTHAYDAAGRRISTRDQNGHKTLFFYNADGDLAASVNALGDVTETKYNDLNQAKQTTAFGTRLSAATLATLTGGQVSAISSAIAALTNASIDATTSQTYTLRGQVDSVTDAVNTTNTYAYNAHGQVSGQVTRIDAAGTTVTTAYNYDRRGQLTQTQFDAASLNINTYSGYDAFGREISRTDARGKVSTTGYDRLGRVLRSTNALATPVTRYTTYDAFDRVLTLVDGLGNTSSFGYDKGTRTVTMTTPEGIQTVTTANRHGQTVVLKNGSQSLTTYTYDLNGRLKTRIEDDGAGKLNLITTSNYDAAGLLKEATDANGIKTAYTYDAVDRVLTRSVDPQGLNLTTVYNYDPDAQGQRHTVTDPSGVVTQTRFTLDGRELEVSVDPAGLNLRTRYAYDPRGHLVTVTEGYGSATPQTTLYVYDRAGRRTQEISGPGGLNPTTVTYGYDKNGNVANRTDGNGNVTRYAYDEDNRLVYTVDPLGGVSKLSYDEEGRVTRTLAFASLIGAASLATLPLTPSLTDVINRTTLSDTDVYTRAVYDKDGRAVFSIDGLNQVTQKSYDANGNVVALTQYAQPITLPNTLSVTNVQNAVNAVASTANDHTTRYIYDAANRLSLSIDPTGAVTEYAYDAAGNVTSTKQYANTVPSGSALQVWHRPNLNSSISTALGTFKAGDTVTATIRFKSPTNAAADMFLGDDGGPDPYDNAVAAGPTYGSDGWTTITLTHTMTHDDVMRVFLYADPQLPTDSTRNVLYDNLRVTSVQRGTVIDDSFDKLTLGNGIGEWTYEILPTLTNVSLADAGPDARLKSLIASLGDVSRDRITRYTYDAAGRQVYHVDATGAVTQTRYDAAGKVTATTQYANAVPSGKALQVSHQPGNNSSAFTTIGTFKAGDVVTATVRFKSSTNAAAGMFLGDPVGTDPYDNFEVSGHRYSSDGWTTITLTHTMTHDDQMRVYLYADSGLPTDSTRSVLYDNLRVASVQRGTVLDESFDKLVIGNAVGEWNYDLPPKLVNVSLTDAGTDASLQSLVATLADPVRDRMARYTYDTAGRQVYGIDPAGAVTETQYDAAGNVTATRQYANTVPSGGAMQLWHRNGTNQSAHVLVGDFKAGDVVTATIRFKSPSNTGASIFLGDAGGPDPYDNHTGTGIYGTGTWQTLTLTHTMTHDDTMWVYLYADYPGSDNSRSVIFDNLVVSSAQRGVTLEDKFDNLTFGQAIGQWTDDSFTQSTTTSLADAGADAQLKALVATLADSGRDRITGYAYDASGRLLSTTDALNATEYYTYDGAGNKTSFKNKKGSLWTYTYDAVGRLKTETSPEVSVAQTGPKDIFDNLTLGGRTNRQIVTRIDYDAFGNVVKRTEAEGLPEQRATTYVYDALNRQVEVIYPEVKVYKNEDAAALAANGATGLAAVSEKDGALTTRTFYDAFGNAVANIDVAKGASYKLYDAMGRVRYAVDAMGYVTEFQFNAFGDMVALTRYNASTTLANALPTGAGSAPSAALVVAALGSDRSKDRTITTAYDTMGRVKLVTEPLVFTYDASTNTYDTAAGKKTQNTYNAFGDLVQRAVSRTANTWTYTAQYYDKAGRQTDVVDAMGNVTRSTYDAVGNLTSQAEFATQVGAANEGSWRNAPGAIASTPSDRIVVYTFDKGNRMVREARLNVQNWSIEAEANGNYIPVAGDSAVATTYGYDALGNLTRTTDATGASTYSYYDALGRIVAFADPVRTSTVDGTALTPLILYERDAHGNVVTKIEMFNGAAAASEFTEVSTSAHTGYPTPVYSATSEDRITLYKYDVLGHEIQNTDATGASHYTSYNERGEVAKIWQGVTSGTPVYENGRLKVNSTLFQAYGYDKLGRLTHTFDPLSGGTFVAAPQFALLSSSVFYEDPETPPGYLYGTNAFQMRWSNVIDALGGVVRIQVDYQTVSTWVPYGEGSVGNPSHSVTRDIYRNAADAGGGFNESWGDEGVVDGGISRVDNITVWQMVDGQWQVRWTGSPDQAVGDRVVAAPPTIIDSAQTYNAFGEVTSKDKGIDPTKPLAGQQEYFKYDNAGRLWGTNGGDGVDRVMFYDLQGNVTSVINSSGSAAAGGEGTALAGLQNASEAKDKLSDRRTNLVYDAIGHQIEQIELPPVTAQDGVSVRGLNVGINITSRNTAYWVGMAQDDGGPYPWTYWTAAPNTVVATWPDLSSLGEGQVLIRLFYRTPALVFRAESWDPDSGAYTPAITYDGSTGEKAWVVSSKDAATGVSLTWAEEDPYYSFNNGIESITGFIVQKQDVQGNWVTLVNRSTSGYVDDALEVAVPRDGVNVATIQYHVPGSSDANYWTSGGVDFGAYLRLDPNSLSLPAGTYEYRVIKVPIGQIENGVLPASATALTVAGTPTFTVVGSATFTVGGAINRYADSTTSLPITSKQTVDRWGNVTSRSDVRNAKWETRFAYDVNSRLISQTETNADGTGTAGGVTTYYYDKLGQLLGVKDALGHINGQRFDAGGNLIEEFHADGGRITHRYDAFGNRLSTTDAVGNEKPEQRFNHTTDYTYDKAGRLRTTTSGPVAVYYTTAPPQLIFYNPGISYDSTRRLVETNVYDQAGRKISQINGAGETTEYRYDLAGHVIESIDPLSQSTKVLYDRFGHKVHEVDALRNSQSWTYDYFGQLTGHTDLGGAAYTYKYDNARQLTRQTSSRGQSLTYVYDMAGHNTSIVDSVLDKTTTYAYDLAGNRTREKTVQQGYVFQDNRLTYDALGRLRDVSDGRIHIGIDYDLMGNRTRISSFHYAVEGNPAVTASNLYFQYNKMNQQVVADSTFALDPLNSPSAALVAGNGQVHVISYDKNGNRESDTFWGNRVIVYRAAGMVAEYDPETGAYLGDYYVTGEYGSQQMYVTQNYVYDAMDRLEVITQDGKEVNAHLYDAAGRTVLAGTGDRSSNQYLNNLNGPNGAAHAATVTDISVYDRAGRVSFRYTYVMDENGPEFRRDHGTQYHYDAVNNITNMLFDQVGQYAIGYGYTEYHRFDRYEADTIIGTSNELSGRNTGNQYDVNGNLVGYNNAGSQRSLVSDANGQMIYAVQNGQGLRQVIVNGDVLGRYAVSGGSDFNFSYQYNNGLIAGDIAQYTVRNGDTLRSLARAMYGDEALWYRIAEANGMADGEALFEGQMLKLPGLVVGTHNNVDTIKRFDPSAMTGSMLPVLGPGGGRASCGAYATAIVAVVVSAVLTYNYGTYTTAPAARLGNSLGQLYNMTKGRQDEFDFHGWNLAGFTAANNDFNEPISASTFNELGRSTVAHESFDWKRWRENLFVTYPVQAGVRAATFYYGSYGGAVEGFWGAVAQVAVSTAAAAATEYGRTLIYDDYEFNWRNVAVAAATATVSLGLKDIKVPDGWEQLGNFAKQAAAKTTAQLIANRGKVEWTQVAIDSFGNVLGGSLAGLMRPGTQGTQGPQETQGEGPWSTADYRNQYDIASDNYVAPAGASAGGRAWNDDVNARRAAGSVDQTIRAHFAKEDADRAYSAQAAKSMMEDAAAVGSYTRKFVAGIDAARAVDQAITASGGMRAIDGAGVILSGASFADGSAATPSAFQENNSWQLGRGGRVEANMGWVGPNGEANFVLPYAPSPVNSNSFGATKDWMLSGLEDSAVWGARQGGLIGDTALWGSSIIGGVIDVMYPGSLNEAALAFGVGKVVGKVAPATMGYLNKLPVFGTDVGQASTAGLRWLGAGLDEAAEQYLNRVGGLSYVVPEAQTARTALPSGIGGTGPTYDKALGQGLYVLSDENGVVRYFGRGDVPARLAVHEGSIDKSELVGSVLWTNNLSKAQAKGLEQALIDQYGGALRQNPGSPLLNEYRSYQPSNPNAQLYRDAVTPDLWQATLKKLGY